MEEHHHSPHLLQTLGDPAAAVQTLLLQVQQALQGKVLLVEMDVVLTLLAAAAAVLVA